MSVSYLLVTAAKNEEQLLPLLIYSITKQTIIPRIWVMVDDGSVDNTGMLMDAAADAYSWITVLHREPGPRHGYRYTEALRQGFDYALEVCEKQNFSFQYLALIDADMTVESTFFNDIIQEFGRIPRLGLASGSVYYVNRNGIRMVERHRLDWPRGSPRIWRRECYREIGGQPIAISGDSIANVKARHYGWELRVFPHLMAEARSSGSTKGYRAHCTYAAESAYFLHYHLLLVLIKAVSLAFVFPHYGFIIFLLAYIREWIRHGPRSSELAVVDYYQHERLLEYKKYLISKVLGRRSEIMINWRDRPVEK